MLKDNCQIEFILSQCFFHVIHCLHISQKGKVGVVFNSLSNVCSKVIWHWIIKSYSDVLHLHIYSKSKQQDFYDRQTYYYKQCSAITNDMTELFIYKCNKLFHFNPLSALRASFLNTSSIVSALNCLLNSEGESSASILPSTIIDTRLQYSASSI